MRDMLPKGEHKIDGGHMLTIAEPREPMPRQRQARLDENPYVSQVRIPNELATWLREYARQNELSVNAAIIEALELLRSSQT